MTVTATGDAADRGVLCLVLHAHMPYVEGFGTWPFGEEWLWEAIAAVYLPLLRVLPGHPVTLGLTPVLCDQLEAVRGDVRHRLTAFLREVRREVHDEDAAGLDRGGEPLLAAEVRRAGEDYAAADRELERLGGDLIGAFSELTGQGPIELWAGPATHPVLPLIATDAARRLQLASGLAAHEARFGELGGGMWLPECAYEPGLERELAAFGVRCFCVDQTDQLASGSLEHLTPVATDAGPVAVPVDWQTVSLVWDERSGYPAAGTYRDSHRRTVHDRMPWANHGGPYDREAASATAREHAEDFVRRTIERLETQRRDRGRPGLVCCALDAELLGHWWYEGPLWLEAVLAEAPRRGLELATLPAALDRVEPQPRELIASSWGRSRDLSTWDAPDVADLTFEARTAELDLVAAAGSRDEGNARPGRRVTLARAARELLALQSSDWAFMRSRALAGAYPLERVAGHRAALDAALASLEDSRAPVPDPALRNLAPALDHSPLTAP